MQKNKVIYYNRKLEGKMKDYFEYEWNDYVRDKILNFYENEEVDSFGKENSLRKTKLKWD